MISKKNGNSLSRKKTKITNNKSNMKSILKHKSKMKSKSKSTKNNNKDEIIKKLSKIEGLEFTKGSEIGTKVQTLNLKIAGQLDGNFAIVDKADGLRKILYLDNNGDIHLLDKNNTNFQKTDICLVKKSTTNYGCLIDSEYIQSVDTYFVFDILTFQDKDVRQLPFIERYKLLEKFNQKNMTFKSNIGTQIKIKKYQIDYKDFGMACRKVYYDKYPYELDGIIFTPLQADYNSSSYKWKPLKDLTIDFICKIRKSYIDERDKKTYLILDLFVTLPKSIRYREKLKFPPNQNYTKYFPTIDNSFYTVPYPFMPEYDHQFNSAIIEVTEQQNKDDDVSLGNGDSLSLMKMKPKYYYRKIEYIDNEPKYNPYTNSNKSEKIVKLIPIMDNTIIEFSYDVFNKNKNPARKWIPYRFRKDRTNQYLINLLQNPLKENKTLAGPNGWRQANSIWQLIHNPITNDMIFGFDEIPKQYYNIETIDRKHTQNMMKFHWYVKEKLYQNYLFFNNFTENILELSAGDGSDASNIVKYKPKFVLMTDIIDTSLKKAKIDFKKFQNIHRNWKTQLETIPLDLRENNINELRKIKKINKIHKFDLVSMHFAFHFMFETNEAFLNLFNLIKDNLNNGGFFTLTCFDGQTVYDELKKNNGKLTITTTEKEPKTLYEIERMYDTTKEFNELDMFGTPIKVFIHSIGDQIEYLVNFNKVINYFKKNGFNLVDSKMFSKVAPQWESSTGGKLTKPEKQFSFLNKYIVFQKDVK